MASLSDEARADGEPVHRGGWRRKASPCAARVKCGRRLLCSQPASSYELDKYDRGPGDAYWLGLVRAGLLAAPRLG
jgi:hypothetical protein